MPRHGGGGGGVELRCRDLIGQTATVHAYEYTTGAGTGGLESSSNHWGWDGVGARIMMHLTVSKSASPHVQSM